MSAASSKTPSLFAVHLSKSAGTNPYFIFLEQFRANLRSREVQSLKPTAVARMAGWKWREMSNVQKSIYIEKAEQNRRVQRASGIKVQQYRRNKKTATRRRKTAAAQKSISRSKKKKA